MTDEPLTLRYMVTADWVKTLRNARKVLGLEVWFYQRALYVLACSAFAFGIAYVGLTIRGASFAQAEVFAVACYIFGVGLFFLWASRVDKLMGHTGRAIYSIGSEVDYEFDAAGFRMRCDGQDWWTSWKHIHKVRVQGDALILASIFTVFALPVKELPRPTEDMLRQIEMWRTESAK